MNRFLRPRSLTGPFVGLYVLKAILIGLAFIVLAVALFQVRNENKHAHRATQTLIQTLAAERTLVSLDGAIESYALQPSRAQLNSATNLEGQLARELTQVGRAAADNHEVASITGLYANIGALEAGFTQMRKGSPAAQATRRSEAAKLNGPLVADADTELSRIANTVASVRRQTRSAFSSSLQLTVVLAAVTFGLWLVLTFSVGTFLVRGILRPMRIVARIAQRIAGGDLSARVPRTGLGEVAQLADSFNEMAAVTEQRRDELAAARERLAQAVIEAEQGSAMKSNFVANMSHELRTPLIGLNGTLSLLRDTDLDPEQRQYLDLAVDSSDTLMAIAGDVLDIAKIEAGRLDLEQEIFDVHALIGLTCSPMAALARAKGVEFGIHVSDTVPRLVCGDQTRVGQILRNLVTNAVKFTDRGRIRVTVSAAPESATVRFNVADTGIGLDEAALESLFEPFIQGDQSASRRFSGTGLGLAIARELTEAMGGWIRASGTRDHGASFTFEIPFAAPDAEQEAARPVRTGRRPLATAGHPARVLVAEDNAANWFVLERMLTGLGASVARACDGGEALLRLEREPFDIVFMDCHMPELDGYETASRWRERERHTIGGAQSHLPIVGMSAAALPNDRRRSLDAGMDDHVLKPLGPERLHELLTRWVPATTKPGGAQGSGSETATCQLAPDRVAQLRELFPDERLATMLSETRADVAGDLAALATAAAAGDRTAVAAAAHRIRNTARVLGADELARRAAALDKPRRRDTADETFVDQGALEALRRSWLETERSLDELSGR